MDINPLWFGIMIAVNLQTSFLTPPFGFALFYFRGIAPNTIKTLDIYKLYQQRLFQINCLDFGDLLLQCINLFKNEDVLKRYLDWYGKYLN